MLSTAEPVANRAGGSDATAALESEASVSPTPAPLSSIPGSSSVA